MDLVLGLGPSYYDDWHRWPWWCDGPVYGTVPVTEYAVAPVAVGPVGSMVIVTAGSDLRDARSPAQVKAIFDDQAAGLIRGD